MIRQAISCDICASEKKQTNHWFVAYEQAGELRVSGWNSRNRQRPGAKHLCGQTCLHKLVDDFMARTLVKAPIVSDVADLELEASYVQPSVPQMNDTSLAAPSARNYARAAIASHTRTETPSYTRAEKTAHAESEVLPDEFESSARLIPSPAAAASTPAHRAPAELVRMPGRNLNEERAAVPAETPRYSSRNWRSEAWERERERELRAAARMRSNG